MKATPLRIPFDNAQKGTGQKWNGPHTGFERFILDSSLTQLSLKFNILRVSAIRTSERKPTQNHILINNSIPRAAESLLPLK